MGKVKLESICTIVSGSTPKSSCPGYWGGSIKWVTPAEIGDETHYIEDTERHITEEGMRSCHLRMMPSGTVLLSSRAPIGKTAITKSAMCCNQGFKNLICSKSISNEYLYHFLNAKADELKSMGRGATFKEISKKQVESIVIDLPFLSEQSQRAAVLNQIDALLKQSHDLERCTDDLVKSRFVEMFDSEKFELVKLGGYCERVTKGATPTTLGYHYQDNGINFIKVESLAENGSIVADKVAHISDECNEAMRRSQLRVGDIVFSIAGAIGRTAIIPDSILPANTNQALAIIRLRSPLAFDRIFLRYALISSDVTRSISSSKRGIAQVNLSLTDIKNLRVPLPPLALQQEFAAFVSQVDKLRFATQQQIEKLETLKKSLMQEYFG